MLKNGAIITDEYMQTSNPDIFAAGDASVVHYNPTGKDDYIPLATNAVRQGILIGHNIGKAVDNAETTAPTINANNPNIIIWRVVNHFEIKLENGNTIPITNM